MTKSRKIGHEYATKHVANFDFQFYKPRPQLQNYTDYKKFVDNINKLSYHK